MAWHAARGLLAEIRHAVRDLSGSLVTGQATALAAGVTLSDPAGASSALPVTASEIGATGWYILRFIPDVAGAWVLTVNNPAAPAADGQIFDYPVLAHDVGVPGWVAGGYGLTTLELVHAHMRIPGAETSQDALFESLIDGVTSQIEARAFRHFGLATYVDVLDGRGEAELWLPQGPLVSVASVELLAYSGTGTAATVIPATSYLPLGIAHGLGGDDDRGRLLRVDGTCWEVGRQNYRVTYDAGYATIPPGLTLDATRLVVAHFRRSDLEGLQSSGALDLSSTPLDPAELDRLTDRIAGQWRLRLGIA